MALALRIVMEVDDVVADLPRPRPSAFHFVPAGDDGLLAPLGQVQVVLGREDVYAPMSKPSTNRVVDHPHQVEQVKKKTSIRMSCKSCCIGIVSSFLANVSSYPRFSSK